MKRLISLLLLGFVILTGQAQVKSGLDICLRDDKTGEWLLGLFDEYAVYNSEVWDYARSINKNHIVLTNGCERIDIQLKKNATVINGVKHKTSELISQYLPDYPAKDETGFKDYLFPEERQAEIIVSLKSGKKDEYYLAFYDNILDDSPRNFDGITDEHGICKIHIPMVSPTKVSLAFRNHSLYNAFRSTDLIVEPGQRLFVWVDDTQNRVYIMGKGSRLNNEIQAHPLTELENFDDVYEARNVPTSVFYQKEEGILKSNLAKIDSVVAVSPLLSYRYQTYMKESLRYRYVMNLVSKTSAPGEPFFLRPELGDIIRKHDLQNPKIPYSTCYEISQMLQFYLAVERELVEGCYRFLSSDRLLARGIPDYTPEERASYEEWKRIYATADSLLLKEGYNAQIEYLNEHHDKLPTVNGKTATREYAEVFQREEDKVNMEITVFLLDSLGIRDDLKQKLIARHVYSRVENKGEATQPEVLETLRQNVSEPYLLSAVLDKNQEYLSYAERAKTLQANIKDSRDFDQMKDGSAVFRKLIEPYRGRYIYLWVQNYWDSFSREKMSYIPAMKEMLKDKDIIYLFVCVQSTDEAWRNSIVKYQLTDKDYVHYNLSMNPGAALNGFLISERTNRLTQYRLITPDGQLLPAIAPSPDSPKALKYMIEELEK